MSADTSQEVLCPNPSCGKRYRLKGAIPAVFTCTKCGQAMDLSAFGGAPAAQAPSTRSSRGGAPGGGRRVASRREQVEHDADERRPRFAPKPKNNTPLIVGSLVGLVIVVVLLVLVMGKKDPPAPAPGETPGAGSGGTAATPGVPVPGVPAAPGVGVPAAGTPPAGTAPATPAAPAAGTPSTPAAPAPAAPTPPAEAGRPRGALSALQTWEPPADAGVTPAEKEQIETLLQTAINDTGRSQRDAEEALVGLGRKGIWRIVSQFKHIHDTLTFEQRKGMIHAMIVDRILRKIDGWMERKGGSRFPITPESSPDDAVSVAKRWNTWLDKGHHKTPEKPWDPKVDEADEGAEKPVPGRR